MSFSTAWECSFPNIMGLRDYIFIVIVLKLPGQTWTQGSADLTAYLDLQTSRSREASQHKVHHLNVGNLHNNDTIYEQHRIIMHCKVYYTNLHNALRSRGCGGWGFFSTLQ